jgi:ubiquinone biosynthesis protein UbiJ
VAVLACLHLADQVKRLERDYDDLNARIASLDARVADTLNIEG